MTITGLVLVDATDELLSPVLETQIVSEVVVVTVLDENDEFISALLLLQLLSVLVGQSFLSDWLDTSTV